MYEVRIAALEINIPNEAEIIKKIIPLIKSVFGYNDDEIKLMIEHFFTRPFATGLNKEQVEMAIQPFYDIGAPIIVREYDNYGNTTQVAVPLSLFNLVEQSPKSHYYDNPIIPREHLVAPDYTPDKPTIDFEIRPKNSTPTITCPYCQSTKCSRISILGRMVSVEFWGFASNKLGKQWHCHDCGSNF